MYIIRKKFKFEMAHQLSSAYSASCKNCIHGHSYILEVFFRSPGLNTDGMVIDFKLVKDKCSDFIQSWDHALVMPSDFSKEYLDILKKYNKKLIITSYNPTAEKMAKDIFDRIHDQIPECYKVRLHESETGYAEYEQN